jgi:hypothetical protein
MEAATANARKVHKSAGAEGAQRMANAARLRVLEKALGTPIKRNRDPGRPTKAGPFSKVTDRESAKDESQIVWKETG